MKIPKRRQLSPNTAEIEAESIAYLVCHRNGITPKSQTYLSNFTEKNMTVNNLDLYQIMRAAGQVENLLGLAAHSKMKK